MIRVGPAGWSYADWEGVVYPRKKPAGFHPLRYLARYVDCVEINSSFYGAPVARNAERWVECVADRPDFRFIVKLQQIFTHEPLPAEPGELEREANRFLEGIEPLIRSERLSAILLQFPFSFRWDPSSLVRLQHIERSFGHLPLVLEVRHRSWFGSEALQAIEALDLSLAAIDLPYAAEHPPPIPWGPSGPPNLGPVGYLRLHGRNADAWFDPRAGRDQRYDYLYGPDEVAEIVKATRRLASGRDETFVITNNHFSGKAVANALEILSELGGEKRLAPSELVQAFPRLRERTRPDGQQTLF